MGVDILLGATVGVPVGGIFVASGATFVARGGGVADGCTSNSSVKRQAAKTSSSTNSDVITFKDISLIPPARTPFAKCLRTKANPLRGRTKPITQRFTTLPNGQTVTALPGTSFSEQRSLVQQVTSRY